MGTETERRRENLEAGSPISWIYKPDLRLQSAIELTRHMPGGQPLRRKRWTTGVLDTNPADDSGNVKHTC